MTAILCPVMVALLDKRIKKKQLNVQNMKEEKIIGVKEVHEE